MILLIGFNNSLAKNLAAILPDHTRLVHLTTVNEAQIHLNTQANDEIVPTFIIINTESNRDALSQCHQLRRQGLLGNILIIAIIADLADRQWALAAGADDYLLLPLLPTEVRARLATQRQLHLGEKTQLQAAQNAFLVLLARLINERLDLNTTLSLTLELTVPLLNATGGDIWLFSTNNQWLDLASSLRSRFSKDRTIRRAKGQGLIGWVAEQGRALHIDIPTDDPRFDPQVDQIGETTKYALVAVPLYHHETTIGVLSVHNENCLSFTNQDEVLLEGVASLTTSTIENARLMQELRDYADQQRVLYEMSQQIASGLDLQATLDRALHWLSRLANTETGLLWLTEPSESTSDSKEDVLRLAATLGFDQPQNKPVILNLEESLAGWVAKNNQPLIINDPANDSNIVYAACYELNLKPRNVISIPMIYHGQVIGVICLLNKINGVFDQADLTLLSTAIEMVTAAVGNARLHAQTVALMQDRERLHKQILQAEQLATVGRLTASLSHEINNPMQAIQGALVLATEEINNPQEVAAYIRMSLQESERVVQLISRMRQIYRPQAEKLQILDITHLLDEAIIMARKELNRQKVTLNVDLASTLPPITATANQLHLVFLNLLLNLGDTIGAAGGGKLWLRSYALPTSMRVEFVASTLPESWTTVFKPDVIQKDEDVSFGLSMSYDIITAHGGTIELKQEEQQSICRIEFPLSTPNASLISDRRPP